MISEGPRGSEDWKFSFSITGIKIINNKIENRIYWNRKKEKRSKNNRNIYNKKDNIESI